MGGCSCRERRRECFTAVSLDFCTTHQNSAACRQELGGRAVTRSVLSVGPLPLTVTVRFSVIRQAAVFTLIPIHLCV